MRAERRRVRVPGGELSLVDAGEGPPLLLLHGFPTSSYLWRRDVPLFSSRMRVIVPDLLGYGLSDKPADVDLSLPAQARRIREVLSALDLDTAAVVGHGLGGGVAQLLALDHPGLVQALGLVDSVAFDAWPSPAVRAIQATLPERPSFDQVERAIGDLFDRGMGHRDRLDAAALDEYLAPWRADPAAFARAARALTGEDLAGRDGELEALDTPAFVVWGEDDAFLPVTLAERLGESLGFSMVALLPGCGHFVGEDAWQTVGPLLYEFLRLRYLKDAHGHVEPGPVPVFLERPTPEQLAAADAEEE
jgi:pimeloyl-ACP methyl ester carboxylesterase